MRCTFAAARGPPGTRTWNLRIKRSLLHRYHESHGKGCLFDRRHYAHPCGRRSILEAGVVGADSPEIVPDSGDPKGNHLFVSNCPAEMQRPETGRGKVAPT